MQFSASTFILIFGALFAPFSALEYIGAENAFLFVFMSNFNDIWCKFNTLKLKKLGLNVNITL